MRNHREREFTVVIEKDSDGWYVASVPQLKGCHTQGKTIDQALQRVKEAILLCLDVEGISKEVELVGVQKIRV
jgi:predicted RNase H-like HicB family nuclease